MADKGSFLTSIIIFYLSIGAAIFQILEEPHLKAALDDYKNHTDYLLQKYPCLKKDDLDLIIEVGFIIWFLIWCLEKQFGDFFNFFLGKHFQKLLEKVSKCLAKVSAFE